MPPGSCIISTVTVARASGEFRIQRYVVLSYPESISGILGRTQNMENAVWADRASPSRAGTAAMWLTEGRVSPRCRWLLGGTFLTPPPEPAPQKESPVPQLHEPA